MFSCTIQCKLSLKEISNIQQLFESEDMMKSDRATLKQAKTKDSITFTIEAKDAVALRATANTVMKTLSVYEKAKV